MDDLDGNLRSRGKSLLIKFSTDLYSSIGHAARLEVY